MRFVAPADLIAWSRDFDADARGVVCCARARAKSANATSAPSTFCSRSPKVPVWPAHGSPSSANRLKGGPHGARGRDPGAPRRSLEARPLHRHSTVKSATRGHRLRLRFARRGTVGSCRRSLLLVPGCERAGHPRSARQRGGHWVSSEARRAIGRRVAALLREAEASHRRPSCTARRTPRAARESYRPRWDGRRLQRRGHSRYGRRPSGGPRFCITQV